MPREEAGEGLRKMLRLLQRQQVVRPRHDQTFDQRQALKQPFVALVVHRAAVAADQKQHRLLQAGCLYRAELPGHH